MILFGDLKLYDLLSRHDPDFGRLFRVAAEFEPHVERNPQNESALAGLLSREGSARGLLPVADDALCALVEHASRLAGESDRLSTNRRALAEIVFEADHLARRVGVSEIDRQKVNGAIEARRDRLASLQQEQQRLIGRGVLLVDTEGERVGQVNGLAVQQIGDQQYGVPMRITATTRPGDGRIVDIQRETELGGHLHSKGVLILGAFLAARYCARRPLVLQASLVFEQSYSPVEGDSASVAELCALISSLSGVPIRQSIAITGSLNQLGQIQAIGGVNAKIEGFFDVCQQRGLGAGQGVVIPAANVRHLMLRDDVVQAVADGCFNVWPVAGIDEAIEVMTGVVAGPVNSVSAGSGVNSRVAARLREFALERAQPRTHIGRGGRGAHADGPGHHV